MKQEAALFAGVALFFVISDIGYALFSGPEPAGTAALTVAALMSSLMSFFYLVNYRKRGLRPEDRKEADIVERSGVLAFFPPSSAYPVATALGAALTALGVVFGLWLFLIGLVPLLCGVLALAFQYLGHEG
ncbi:cytochrome c oxidase subunit 4 [Streptomyces palmae]|uniref:cytochrome-c oxidase n=1 Tax=Streptomyces palmae TaxID=1701085 RepID=A0A4Z0HCY5_9ACTN|nr:cytochrome c oxidase subunit 4 [Streptomyces palmae]TGB18052.1 cytochrome c oxidase subunit 4 [Streptomyces palmae]